MGSDSDTLAGILLGILGIAVLAKIFEKKCPYCGKSVQGGSKSCPHCGGTF